MGVCFNSQPASFGSKKASEYLLQICQYGNYNQSDITLLSNVYIDLALAHDKSLVSIYGENLDENGKEIIINDRIIVYNPLKFSFISAADGNDWAIISILAHEVGHHQYNHGYSKHSLTNELEADKFSGKVMAKFGATFPDLIMAQKYCFSLWGSNSHPDSMSRIDEIVKGYKDGDSKNDVETDWNKLQLLYEGELKKW